MPTTEIYTYEADQCPHCTNMAQLAPVFSMQRCQHCGMMIAPCEYCDATYGGCDAFKNDCPLDNRPYGGGPVRVSPDGTIGDDTVLAYVVAEVDEMGYSRYGVYLEAVAGPVGSVTVWYNTAAQAQETFDNLVG